MWANAQRDGRPAKYRWRPLFNAAVWLTPTTRVPCSNAAKTRNRFKFAGVPQTRQQISAISGPNFTILRGHVEEVLLFNNFFLLSMHALVAKIQPDKLCKGAEMAIFGEFFASYIFSEPRAVHFRPAF